MKISKLVIYKKLKKVNISPVDFIFHQSIKIGVNIELFIIDSQQIIGKNNKIIYHFQLVLYVVEILVIIITNKNKIQIAPIYTII
jgi:hypothetical protein